MPPTIAARTNHGPSSGSTSTSGCDSRRSLPIAADGRSARRIADEATGLTPWTGWDTPLRGLNPRPTAGRCQVELTVRGDQGSGQRSRLGSWIESWPRARPSTEEPSGSGRTRSSPPCRAVLRRHAGSAHPPCAAGCTSRPWSAARRDCRCRSLRRRARPASPSGLRPSAPRRGEPGPTRTASPSRPGRRARRSRRRGAGDWSGRSATPGVRCGSAALGPPQRRGPDDPRGSGCPTNRAAQPPHPRSPRWPPRRSSPREGRSPPVGRSSCGSAR